MSDLSRNLIFVVAHIAAAVTVIASPCVAAEQSKYDQITEALKSDNLALADRLTTETLKVTPNDAYLWFLCSTVDFNKENYKACERALLRALELDPTMSKARYNLALLYSIRFTPIFHPPKSEPILEDLIKRDPDFIPAYALLGQIYHRLQKLDKAEKMLLLARKREPDNWRVGAELAELYRDMKDYSRAVKTIDQTIEAFPRVESLPDTRREIVKSWVTALLDDFQFGKAMPIIEKELVRNDAALRDFLLFSRAFIHGERRQVSEAEEAYMALMENKESMPGAKLSLGRLYALLNVKPDKAIAFMGNVKKAVFSVPDWRRNVIAAVAYLDLGDMKSAEDELGVAARLLSFDETQKPTPDVYSELDDEFKYARALLEFKRANHGKASFWLSTCNPDKKSLLHSLCRELRHQIDTATTKKNPL